MCGIKSLVLNLAAFSNGERNINIAGEQVNVRIGSSLILSLELYLYCLHGILEGSDILIKSVSQSILLTANVGTIEGLEGFHSSGGQDIRNKLHVENHCVVWEEGAENICRDVLCMVSGILVFFQESGGPDLSDLGEDSLWATSQSSCSEEHVAEGLHLTEVHS